MYENFGIGSYNWGLGTSLYGDTSSIVRSSLQITPEKQQTQKEDKVTAPITPFFSPHIETFDPTVLEKQRQIVSQRVLGISRMKIPTV